MLAHHPIIFLWKNSAHELFLAIPSGVLGGKSTMVRLIQCKEHQTTIKLRLVWKHGENEFDRSWGEGDRAHPIFSRTERNFFPFLFTFINRLDSSGNQNQSDWFIFELRKYSALFSYYLHWLSVKLLLSMNTLRKLRSNMWKTKDKFVCDRISDNLCDK